MIFPDATLLIIGHGSTVNGDSGATVYQHAAAIRQRGLFADVREAFFKIAPRIGPTLAEIRTPRIFVVPLFVSEGYFTRQAIPCELGLPVGAQDVMPCSVRMDGRDVIYCDPVGTHPLMTEIILARAEAVLKSSGEPTPAPSQSPSENSQAPESSSFSSSSSSSKSSENRGRGRERGGGRQAEHNFLARSGAGNPETPDPRPQTRLDTALVIAGHGTALNPDSRKSIDQQVQLIAAQNIFAEVHPAFLEEDPRIAEISNFVKAPRIVVVPFFMSDGLHVCEDIPVLLGEAPDLVQARLKAGEWPWPNPTAVGDKTIFYTPGVGSEPGIADVILERVRAAVIS